MTTSTSVFMSRPKKGQKNGTFTRRTLGAKDLKHGMHTQLDFESNMSVCLSVCPSVCLSVCLSVCHLLQGASAYREIGNGFGHLSLTSLRMYLDVFVVCSNHNEAWWLLMHEIEPPTPQEILGKNQPYRQGSATVFIKFLPKTILRYPSSTFENLNLLGPRVWEEMANK